MAGRLSEVFKERHDEIVKLRTSGMTYPKMAEIFGCSSTSIRTYCVANGIQGTKKMSLVGKSFDASQLTVLDLDLDPPFKSHETAYKCKCNICGDVATYRRTNVVDGPGCHKCSGTKGGRGYREWEVGQKFGFIKILRQGERAGYVVGECVCGTVREFALQHLKGQGHSRTVSCGCKQKSSGELKIESILEENGIRYQAQYKIPEFSQFALFDFAIFNDDGSLKKLVEYDGEQHFLAIDHFGGEEKLKIQQERDARKNEWCAEHGIELLRIPYTDYHKITLELLVS
jgi:very-short-patch-repair endonuclease